MSRFKKRRKAGVVKAGPPGFSRLFPLIPGEFWKDRHNRRAELAQQYKSAIAAWCEYRGVIFKDHSGHAIFKFLKNRAYAAWNFKSGWLRYCPDWKEQPDGPTYLKANCPEQLLSALERVWLRETA